MIGRRIKHDDKHGEQIEQYQCTMHTWTGLFERWICTQQVLV